MRVGANGTIFVCPYYLDAPGHVTSQSSAEPGIFWEGRTEGLKQKNASKGVGRWRQKCKIPK